MINSLKRYGVLLVDAWSSRDQLGHSVRQGAVDQQMLEFLPAALEIQERPASPLGRLLGWTLMTLFTIAVGWAFVGEVDIVAIAEGKIIPGSRVKQIQPLEKGVVKTIFVKEGQTVSAGEPLVELDQALTQAEQERLRNELQFVQLNLVRKQSFLALLKGADAELPVSVKELSLASTIELTSTQRQVQKSLLWQEWRDYQSQLGALNSQLHNRMAEHQVSVALVEKLQGTLPLVTKRTEAVRSLLEKSLAPEIQYLELEQARIEQQQDLVAEKARAQQLLAAIQEVEFHISALLAESHSQILLSIEDSERQIVSITQELNKAQDINAKQILYAPVDGKVQQLAIHTVGGVVTEAQSLMLIVPKEDYLEVEATLGNKDIGFVRQGQMAEVKVHTFPFTKYGIINAEVVDITADAVVDEQQGLVYKLRLKMKTSQLWINQQWVDLLPGMLVSAEVKTGKRKLIEFVAAPLMRYKQESVRER